jgi:ABC-type transport system involved in multi-copper enzyme maturation permease subunit
MRKTILALIPSLILLTVSTAFVPAQSNTPPLSLTLILLGFCCLTLLVIGVIALGLFVRNQNQKEKKEG